MSSPSIQSSLRALSSVDFLGALLRARVAIKGLLETNIGSVVDVTVFKPEVQLDRAVYACLRPHSVCANEISVRVQK